MWYSSGDLNKKFYHALIKQRRVRDIIVGLHDAAEIGLQRIMVWKMWQ